MRIIIQWLVASVAIFVTAYLLPGVSLSGFSVALVAAVVLGIVTFFISPLLKLLALPFNFLTFWVFSFAVDWIITALFIMLTSAIVPGFKVKNFGWALIFALILSVVKFILEKYLKTAY